MRAVLALLALRSVALPSVRASSTDRHFYDAHGRVRIFHGFNRVPDDRHPEPWYWEAMYASDREARSGDPERKSWGRGTLTLPSTKR